MIRQAATLPPCLISDHLGKVAHGFFSRHGGVSTGLYASLNCGVGSNDDQGNVEENRQRVLDGLGQNAVLHTVHQVHSAEAVFIASPDQPRVKADAMVTTTPDIALGILAADCMPVLFHDPDAKIIGAAHAGWKGALGGVLEACLALMIDQGAKPENILACIGPCLRPPHFQVRNDLVSAFIEKYPFSTRFFTEDSNETWQCDLAGFGMWRLLDSGIPYENISDTRLCTLAHPQDYFSYRHARQNGHEDYGRNLSAIML